MLTYDEAVKIGIDACVEKIGRDFVEKYKDSACSAYGDRGDYAFCFVGVTDKPVKEHSDDEPLVLRDEDGDQYPYSASCKVFFVDSSIEFLECKLPA